MREPSMNPEQKEEILKKCFGYFVRHGLEGVTMRKMCEQTGIAVSSAYYWFGNKDKAILDATEWGLKFVSDRLFDYVYRYRDNLECVILTFSEYAMKYKEELRFVHQVATSQKYGSEMRPIANRLTSVYDKYIATLASEFKCDENELRPYGYLFVSSVLDYVVWHDKPKMETEIACIFRSIRNIIEQNS